MRTGCNPQAGQDAGRTAAPKRPASLPRSRSRSPHPPLPRAGEAAPAVSEASADMAAPAYSPAGMQAGTVPGAEAAGRDSAVTAGRDLPVVYTSSRRWLCSCSLDSYHHSSKRMVFFRLQLRYAARPEIVRGAALLLFRPNSTIMEKTKLLEVWLPWYENSFAR